MLTKWRPFTKLPKTHEHWLHEWYFTLIGNWSPIGDTDGTRILLCWWVCIPDAPGDMSSDFRSAGKNEPVGHRWLPICMSRLLEIGSADRCIYFRIPKVQA